MFGYHKNKRAKKKLKQQTQDLQSKQKAFDEQSPQREKEAADLQNAQIAEKTQQAKDTRNQAYAEGTKRAEELFKRDVEGLDPVKRKAMQYEANKGIQRSLQSASRKLLGEQGLHGISPKSGVAYAQQKDLKNMADAQVGGVTRDLDKLDADLALKKLAAMVNLEQGEASQAQLDRQLAIDELQLTEEKKRQRAFEDQINRLFSRV